jgi:hypothetical protein
MNGWLERVSWRNLGKRGSAGGKGRGGFSGSGIHGCEWMAYTRLMGWNTDGWTRWMDGWDVRKWQILDTSYDISYSTWPVLAARIVLLQVGTHTHLYRNRLPDGIRRPYVRAASMHVSTRNGMRCVDFLDDHDRRQVRVVVGGKTS